MPQGAYQSYLSTSEEKKSFIVKIKSFFLRSYNNEKTLINQS